MPDIEQLLKRVVDEAAAGNQTLCILLESATTPDRWVQLTWDAINAAYPFTEEPLAKIDALGLPRFPYLELTGWEPGNYATFEHAADDLTSIAAFVTAYLERVLSVSTETIRVSEEYL